MQYVFGILLTLTAVFLILLVLVQRGRGGGLAGAFGGMGGQSAFGTKAGDAFTKITIGASVFWLFLCITSVKFLGHSTGAFGTATAPQQSQMVPRPEDTPLLPAEGDPIDGGAMLPSETPSDGSSPAEGSSGAEPTGTDPENAGTAPAEVTSGTDPQAEEAEATDP